MSWFITESMKERSWRQRETFWKVRNKEAKRGERANKKR